MICLVLGSTIAGDCSAEDTVRTRSEIAKAEASTEPVQRQPNIILVFIDDLGWGDFSCYGNELVETENIDRLAKEGIKFTQFYVNSPICSPSRVAITTGLYPQRCRIGSYLARRELNEARGIAHWLDAETKTLADLLHDAGYVTGHFGKWHMGGQRDVGEAPLITEYGFDESLTNFEGLGDRVIALLDSENGKPPRKHALGSDRLGRGKIQYVPRPEVTAVYTEAAFQFIRQAEAEGKPFYVNLWPDDVHTPLAPPAERMGDGSKQARYLGVLDTMDEQLGELFDYVRESPSLRVNTLILVCSDNGPEQGAGTAGGLRGWKTQLYEGGIRSPLVVWGPGLVSEDAAGGENSSTVLAAMDLLPSLCSIAGVEVPATLEIDGQSFGEALLGRSQPRRGSPILFRRPPDRDAFFGDPDLPDLAIRSGKWKLLCEYDGSQRHLYDIEADPQETINLATSYADIAEALAAEVVNWHLSLPLDHGDSYREPDSR